MDGIAGCIKNIAFRAVLLEKIVIHFPDDFAHYAHSNIKDVLAQLMATSKITEEPYFIRETSYVESMFTPKVHMVKPFKTKAGFYYLQFFKIASDNNPFYTHWYHHLCDLTGPYGHTDLLVHYVVNESLRYVRHYAHSYAVTNSMITSFVL